MHITLIIWLCRISSFHKKLGGPLLYICILPCLDACISALVCFCYHTMNYFMMQEEYKAIKSSREKLTTVREKLKEEIMPKL